jgi:signal transduction histidine kinase
MDILAKSNHMLLEMVQGILEPATNAEAEQSTREEIKRILDSAIHSYQALAETKGVFIQTRVAKDIPPLPLSKSETIRVVGNLVDNALKYTDAGYIYIHITKQNSPGTERVIFSVQDTGRGMTSERIEEVLSGNLKPDTEFSSSRGLGLAGVRTLVEARGGKLEIDSEPARGTKITIRF